MTPITLGGKRYEEQTVFADDYDGEEEISPLDDDYIREEYSDADE